MHWPCAVELLLPSQTQVQSVQLSFLSYGHTKTDIQRGVERGERALRLTRGAKMGGKMDIFNVKNCVFSPSIDFKNLRKIKNIIKVNLIFTIPHRGGHFYCSSRTSINLATPLTIPCNSVNSNTHKPLSMQQQLHFALGQLLLLYRTKWLLYKSSAVTLVQSAPSIHTVACLVPATQHNSRNLPAAVCVVRRVLCSNKSYKMDCNLVRFLKWWGKRKS